MPQAGHSNVVRFLLNGELQQVTSPPPTLTVLNYLRETQGLCGTKEGCAEGDCGACTTVLVDVYQGQLRTRPMNACIQLLPTIDGKSLWTVEGLAARDESLHPVQEAMVECHGSQCGFCTPGFVMSLFALYKNDRSPDRARVKQALAGNLCRCTGYRPILDAADKMYDLADGYEKTHWKHHPGSAHRDEGGLEGLARIERHSALDYQSSGLDGSLVEAPQRYIAPLTIDELSEARLRYPEATLLAGGTDIGLWLTKQYRELGTIIYVGQVKGLDEIVTTSKIIEIGAGVTLESAFAALVQEYPELDEMVRRFASPPICSSGTLAGNVANGSPIGDSMPALICLGAQVKLQRGTEQRWMALEDFYLGYQQNALQSGEFVRAVCVPRRSEGLRVACYKWSKRFDQDISAVCAAFAVRVEAGNVVSARICYGGMAAIPKRAEHAEDALLTGPWSDQTVKKAVEALRSDYQPISDMRASASYRALAAENLLIKFYLQTAAQQDTERVFALDAAQERTSG